MYGIPIHSILAGHFVRNRKQIGAFLRMAARRVTAAILDAYLP
jgi:hypothetical protein